MEDHVNVEHILFIKIRRGVCNFFVVLLHIIKFSSSETSNESGKLTFNFNIFIYYIEMEWFNLTRYSTDRFNKCTYKWRFYFKVR